ncbi:hypothetical protein XH99_06665 [Bradyrhizobium nanningense]|uniref:Uncharacterized protein n=1 Tax=Bradyrhizobium nanningense TaxID=1325118 RepID=A0A4Q0SCW5_9BRAD|nr:hypothetical protein [Bradyrhizobium nanningense]RXH36643.1 hypothetical protein XH99_06665 [Bradyrhizobium nanningense]
MTAINCLVTSDAVHLFTDAGQADPASMRLQAISSKVALLPEYNAVFAANGMTFVEQLFRSVIAQSRFDDFDALVSAFPEVIKRAIESGTHYGMPAVWPNCEIILAGWSPRLDVPAAFVFASYDKFIEKRVKQFIRPSISGLAFDPQDIERSGFALMCKQRDTHFPVEDPNEGGFIKSKSMRRVVHGFCQHTVVTRDAISTRLLERWLDAPE